MKVPTGSKYLLKKQLLKVIDEAIPRLDSPAKAEVLQADICRMRQNGVCSDSQYLEWMRQIKEVYRAHNWVYTE